jgi:hypothetical protein
MERTISLVKPEKEKAWWKLGDVELNLLEAAIFNGVLRTCATGKKTITDLKEMGTVRANRKGGYIVDFKVSQEKKASLMFGRKWGEYYEYRYASFSRIKEEVIGIDN